MNDHYKFENLPLPYSYDSLEPYIDEKTIKLHHDKHLKAYIDNLNAVLVDCEPLQKLSLKQLILSSDRFPLNVREKIKNNAGGIYNHRFYFDGLINPSSKYPIGKLKREIDENFCDFKDFQNKFEKAALSVFGSGYAWLTKARCGRLKIITTTNQNTPLTLNLCPILTIDVWEHAYYLKYNNRRADYIDNYFNIVNWEKAEENYCSC